MLCVSRSIRYRAIFDWILQRRGDVALCSSNKLLKMIAERHVETRTFDTALAFCPLQLFLCSVGLCGRWRDILFRWAVNIIATCYWVRFL